MWKKMQMLMRGCVIMSVASECFTIHSRFEIRASALNGLFIVGSNSNLSI